MKILLLVDGAISPEKIRQLNASASQISLFSLTGNFITLDNLTRQLTAPTIMLDSAALINAEVTLLQNVIHAWSHDLSNYAIKGRTLKDWFTLPDKNGSAWWFSMLAEKNSVQDNAFFLLAQSNALAKHVNSQSYDACYIALTNRRLARILQKIAAAKIARVTFLACDSGVAKSFKHKLLAAVNHKGMGGALIMASIYWLVWLKDSFNARKILPLLATRLHAVGQFLFVTYFPNIDEEAAQQGIFKNKYALTLQDKMAELALPVTWLVMPVLYNGHNFVSSMCWSDVGVWSRSPEVTCVGLVRVGRSRCPIESGEHFSSHKV